VALGQLDGEYAGAVHVHLQPALKVVELLGGQDL
jgi:hypothetical protein